LDHCIGRGSPDVGLQLVVLALAVTGRLQILRELFAKVVVLYEVALFGNPSAGSCRSAGSIPGSPRDREIQHLCLELVPALVALRVESLFEHGRSVGKQIVVRRTCRIVFGALLAEPLSDHGHDDAASLKGFVKLSTPGPTTWWLAATDTT
jgi:hypothetical protein